jgi:hypothetical protein
MRVAQKLTESNQQSQRRRDELQRAADEEIDNMISAATRLPAQRARRAVNQRLSTDPRLDVAGARSLARETLAKNRLAIDAPLPDPRSESSRQSIILAIEDEFDGEATARHHRICDGARRAIASRMETDPAFDAIQARAMARQLLFEYGAAIDGAAKADELAMAFDFRQPAAATDAEPYPFQM